MLPAVQLPRYRKPGRRWRTRTHSGLHLHVQDTGCEVYSLVLAQETGLQVPRFRMVYCTNQEWKRSCRERAVLLWRRAPFRVRIP